MANIFKQAQFSKAPSNVFDMSHDVKLSFDMGELIPVFLAETLPGDRWQIRSENFLRFAPLVAPVMHNIVIDTHYFYVGNRLLWSEWDDFIGGISDPAPAHPTLSRGGYQMTQVGALGDYLGLVPGVTVTWTNVVNPMPVAAYFMIYDYYYRDQNLQAEAFTPLVSGDNFSAYALKLWNDPYKRSWNHDYFTSCLPFAQKGDTVTLPLLNAGTATVQLKSSGLTPMSIVNTSGSSISGDLVADVTSLGELQADTTSAVLDPDDNLYVDLSSDAVDITTLRNAFALQAFLEKDARGGTRAQEVILAHFGVHSSDTRSHQPEYLGGIKQQMVISEVLSQAETLNSSNAVTTPVGQMAGHGVSVGGGNTIYCNCEDHGWIMGIMSVRPRTAYQDGLHKMYTREDRFDYAWPGFAHIGEQAVTVGEVYFKTATDAERSEVFGYIPRYSEYKYMNSRVAGDFRDTLDFWHLGRQFTSKPALNSNFIECDPDKRIFAAPSEDGIYAHIIHNVKVNRKLPRFSTPSLMTY